MSQEAWCGKPGPQKLGMMAWCDRQQMFGWLQCQTPRIMAGHLMEKRLTCGPVHSDVFFFVVFPSQIRKLSVLGLLHFTANFKVQPQPTKILFAKAPFHGFRSCRQNGRFPRCKSLGWHVIVAAAVVAAVVRRCILQTSVTMLDTWESKHCCILNRFDQSTWHGDKGGCFSSSSSRLGVKQGKVSDQARYEGRDSRADSWRDGLLQKPLRCFDCVC